MPTHSGFSKGMGLQDELSVNQQEIKLCMSPSKLDTSVCMSVTDRERLGWAGPRRIHRALGFIRFQRSEMSQRCQQVEQCQNSCQEVLME